MLWIRTPATRLSLLDVEVFPQPHRRLTDGPLGSYSFPGTSVLTLGWAARPRRTHTSIPLSFSDCLLRIFSAGLVSAFSPGDI